MKLPYFLIRAADVQIRNVNVIMEGFKEVGCGGVCSVGICERNQRVTEGGGIQQTEDFGLLMRLSAAHFPFPELTFRVGWKESLQKSSS